MHYTVGYSNFKSIEDFIEALKKRKIKTLVDVRSRPYSRFYYQYNRTQLPRHFIKSKINYVHEPSLGIDVFRNLEPKFRKQFVEKYTRGQKDSVVFMCCEKSLEDCHRRIIGEILQENYGGDILMCGRLAQDAPSSTEKPAGAVPVAAQPTLFPC